MRQHYKHTQIWQEYKQNKNIPASFLWLLVKISHKILTKSYFLFQISKILLKACCSVSAGQQMQLLRELSNTCDVLFSIYSFLSRTHVHAYAHTLITSPWYSLFVFHFHPHEIRSFHWFHSGCYGLRASGRSSSMQTQITRPYRNSCSVM